MPQSLAWSLPFYDVNCFIILICKLLKLVLLCIQHIGMQKEGSEDESQNFLTQGLY